MQLECHNLVGHWRGDTVELPLQTQLQGLVVVVAGSVGKLQDHLLLPLAGLDRLEQFIGFHQKMTRAARRIDQGEFFGVESFRCDRRQLGFHFIRLFRGLDRVLFVAFER